MMPTKQLNSNVVPSIADNDLVTIPSQQGELKNITFENFMKAVRERIQIGGRNLLKDSDTQLSSSNYFLGSYPYASLPEIGDEVTVTIWGELGQGKISFDVFNGGGDGNRGFASAVEIADGIYRCAFKIKANPQSQRYVQVFAVPYNVKSLSTINRIKMERGNIATDWTPAPEDIASGTWGGNWLLRNQLQFSRERRCA